MSIGVGNGDGSLNVVEVGSGKGPIPMLDFHSLLSRYTPKQFIRTIDQGNATLFVYIIGFIRTFENAAAIMIILAGMLRWCYVLAGLYIHAIAQRVNAALAWVSSTLNAVIPANNL